MKTQLTDDKFKDIYTSEKFRNEVAYAHGCYKENMVFVGFGTCSYPTSYYVTEDQINEAKKELERAKKQLIEDSKGKLLFTGMGMNYEAKYEDDVCNYRIRTEFINSKGRKFFIELGTGQCENMRCDHSIDRDLEEKYKNSSEQPYNNYKRLERLDNYPKYTLKNVLDFINSNFECNFKEIIIDHYNISPSDNVSISPK